MYRTEHTLVIEYQSVVVVTFPKEYIQVRYHYSRYRYGCRRELTELSGTGIDVVPKLSKCLVPVLMSYRSYRSVRYRH